MLSGQACGVAFHCLALAFTFPSSHKIPTPVSHRWNGSDGKIRIPKNANAGRTLKEYANPRRYSVKHSPSVPSEEEKVNRQLASTRNNTNTPGYTRALRGSLVVNACVNAYHGQRKQVTSHASSSMSKTGHALPRALRLASYCIS